MAARYRALQLTKEALCLSLSLSLCAKARVEIMLYYVIGPSSLCRACSEAASGFVVLL